MAGNHSSQLSSVRQKELVVINKVLATLVVVLAFSTGYLITERETEKKIIAEEPIPMAQKTYPLPDFNGIMVDTPKQSPLVNLLKQARYTREFDAISSVSKEALLSLVWAGQGQITDWGERTVPSYRSQFPLEVWVLVRRVDAVAPGWYQFEARSQQLVPADPVSAVVHNDSAPLVIFVRQTNQAMPSDALVWQEAGGVAQNVLLMTKELRLTAGFIPADLPHELPWLWQMPIGVPAHQ